MTPDRWLGATIVPDEGCSFVVWAPNAERVEVHLLDPVDQVLELEARDRGYFAGLFRGVGAGARYRYRLDGEAEHADPASRLQPEGVHGPSEIFDPAPFAWTDAGFNAPPFAELDPTLDGHGGFPGQLRRDRRPPHRVEQPHRTT